MGQMSQSSRTPAANSRTHSASYQTIGYLGRGEYSPSLHLALRIAAHFEVPIEVIFSTTPFPCLGAPGPSQ